ncbi:MAG TPA: hypothetical protein VF101_01545 [Gaiellaceae bacterium]
MTNAHVIRKGWIEQLYPDVPSFRHRHVRREADPFDVWWSKKEADFKVRCACKGCNSGWMDRLDRAAERIFATDAARGRETKVERLADRKTLARWCCLVAILWDQKQKPPRLGPDVHRAVFDGEIPDGTGIWLVSVEAPTGRQPLLLYGTRATGTTQTYARKSKPPERKAVLISPSSRGISLPSASVSCSRRPSFRVLPRTPHRQLEPPPTVVARHAHDAPLAAACAASPRSDRGVRGLVPVLDAGSARVALALPPVARSPNLSACHAGEP